MANDVQDRVFRSNFFLPKHVANTLIHSHPSISEWKADNLLMYASGNYAVNAGRVFQNDDIKADEYPLFAFEVVNIPGSAFLHNGPDKTVNPNKEYAFIVFNFMAYAAPDNHDFGLAAEILVRLDVVQIGNRPCVDLWIEPSFDERLNTWLDGRPETALSNYGLALLNVFNYIQQKMLREQKRIILFQERERKAVTDNANTRSTKPRTIKVGCLKYQYEVVTAEDNPTRAYNRHAEAWGVRGHYRRYKSGKVIFVRPHIRGKGKVKRTDYAL